MEFHPAANLFPLMGETELAELAADIRTNGLNHPVVTLDGLILDGRNRFLACRSVGIAPRFREWDGDGSPTAWVLSENLHRRHLTGGQRAAIAVEALPLFEAEARERCRVGAEQTNRTLGRGGQTGSADLHYPSERGRATEKAGAAVGANGRQVAYAKALHDHAPELFAQVKAGEKTITAATEEAKSQGKLPEAGPRPPKNPLIRPVANDDPRSTLMEMTLKAPGPEFGCHLERAESLGQTLADELATAGCLSEDPCLRCGGAGYVQIGINYDCPKCLGHKSIAHGIDWVGLEGFSYGNRGAQEVLGILYACLQQAIRGSAYGRLAVPVPPSTVKQFTTGKGNAAKDVMLKEVFRRWGYDTTDNNRADAYSIARIGLALKGRELDPAYPLLAYEERALAELLGTPKSAKTARRKAVAK